VPLYLLGRSLVIFYTCCLALSRLNSTLFKSLPVRHPLGKFRNLYVFTIRQWWHEFDMHHITLCVRIDGGTKKNCSAHLSSRII
ncbi:unnamed protein product, partial [Larinioides sclopetarius]